jgi:hypothetical protein
MTFQSAMGLSMFLAMQFSRVGKAQSTKNYQLFWWNKEGIRS